MTSVPVLSETCPFTLPVIVTGLPQASTYPSTVPLTTTDPWVTETLPRTSPSTTTGPFHVDTLPRVTDPARMCWPPPLPLPEPALGTATRAVDRAIAALAAASRTSRRTGLVCAHATPENKGGGRSSNLGVNHGTASHPRWDDDEPLSGIHTPS